MDPGLPANNKRLEYQQSKEAPRERVGERLDHLMALELGVLDPLVVLPDALDELALVLL